MTSEVEKAIKMLQSMKYEDDTECSENKALDMAIKSLEQKPILDKIRAEIDDLDRFYDNDYYFGNRDSMFKCNEVMQILDKYKAEIEPQESEDKE